MTRRMHVTSYLYGETPEALFRFTEAACRQPCFREVFPVRRDDGQVIAFVFVSDGVVSESLHGLEGILGRDIELSAACDPGGGRRVLSGRTLVIRGRSSEIRCGEVVSVRLELES
jgi:hypothetical protein